MSRIDQAWYDRSGYFEGAASRFADLQSRFQRYRIEKVLAIHTPGPHDRVIDLGCGWGTFEWALAPNVGEIVGVDFSATSIALCEERLRTEARPNVRFLQADAGDTGLPGDSADVVICADLFEHLYPEDSGRVAREAFRLLRPGGHFVVWTPHRGHLLEILRHRRILLKPDPSHVDYKSTARMTQLLEGAGFRIDSARYVESHLPVLSSVERALQGWVPFLRRRIAVLGTKVT